MTERRAPVQATYHPQFSRRIPAGTIAWDEHVEAWEAYAKKYGRDQSAERMAERAGFSREELTTLLGRPPSTWRPVREVSTGDLTVAEISAARAADRLRVTVDGLGFVCADWLVEHRRRSGL